MSDAVKWALLVAGAVMIVGMIMLLPFVEFIDLELFATSIAQVAKIIGSSLIFGRGIINNFLHPWGRNALNGLLIWLFAKWAIMVSIKAVVWVYHFIFK